MKRTVISILIFLGTFSLNAQNKVVVTVTTSKINNETYITTTITNKNAEIILIPVKGFADDYCNVFNGGPSYITLNAYDESHLTAPCTTVPLSQPMLKGIESLTTRYSLSISEIAGASHSVGSTHYSGNAIDVNVVN